MRFRTQEELLRHIGKSNDRNLIKRMMERGEVWRENGMYCLEGEEEEKSAADLRVISHAMGEKVLDHGEIMRLKEENTDLRRHLAYVWERCDARQTAIDSMVQSYFNKNRQSMDFDAAKEKLYSIIGFAEDPNEKDERQFAIDQGALLE